MKTLLLISSLLFAQIALGQHSKDTTISKWTLDSLRSELWQKSGTINRMRWTYQLKVNTSKVDTIFIRQDSIVINRWTKDNRQLYQESINLRKVSFKKEYCKGLIVKRFFNDDERLRQIERVIYDKAGQKIKRLTYEYQSYRPEIAYQITYSYENGKENQTVKK
ncbi:MAG: hypothetical protein KF746_23380 [Chitinophagaceae bacterium]|nr:hypothetical protein [Chitinophagaceae bacterium]